ncbi:MAG: type I methionyl aminopeptidase [bacterium]
MKKIYLNSLEELKKIQSAAETTALILSEVSTLVKPGITTKYLDEAAAGLMKQHGVKAAFLNYRGYPAHICTSIDEEVVHGIPSSKRFLNEGQTISIDLGVLRDGYYGDMAVTLPVGSISEEKKKLLKIAEEALKCAIDQCRVGFRLGDVSSSIQKKAESAGYSVVRDYVGHGIGRAMHEEPQIPNYGMPGTGIRLKSGMVFALEPMVNTKTHEVEVLKDGWTVVTKDRKPSAHFEKMVAITEEGPKVLATLK